MRTGLFTASFIAFPVILQKLSHQPFEATYPLVSRKDLHTRIFRPLYAILAATRLTAPKEQSIGAQHILLTRTRCLLLP